MGPFTALALLASVVPVAGSTVPPHVPAKVTASAKATVRILPGAKVSLSGQAEAQGYQPTNAMITVEDGSRRPAKLVEFQ